MRKKKNLFQKSEIKSPGVRFPASVRTFERKQALDLDAGALCMFLAKLLTLLEPQFQNLWEKRKEKKKQGEARWIIIYQQDLLSSLTKVRYLKVRRRVPDIQQVVNTRYI